MADLLQRLEKPLRFAAGRSFENLRALRDLEKTLLRAAEQARDDPHAPRILELATGIDALQFEEKRERVQAILQMIDAPEEKPRPKPKPRSIKRIAMEEATPDAELERLVGIGPKTAERYRDKGMRTVKDALLFLPRRFEDRSTIRLIQDLRDGESAVVRGNVLTRGARPTGRGKRIFEMVVADGTGRLSCKWFAFRQTTMESTYRGGQRVMVSGKVSFWGASCQMVHPDVEILGDEDEPEPPGVLPMYGEIAGVPPKKVRAIQQGLAESAAKRLEEHLPEE